MTTGPYILITAAKNEEAYIGAALESVLRQTVQPLAWFIMDDGSTDKTAHLVETAASRHPFIQLHSSGAGKNRNFGSQYKAIQTAYQLATELPFEFVGIHDADIAPGREDYYEQILAAFRRNTRLGIAGGCIWERQQGEWRARPSNSPDSVAGGIQMFRRTCFDQIGGYTPLHHGGSDWLAQLEARRAGWETQAYAEFPVHHYRPTSSANGPLRGSFLLGLMDASFGSGLWFEVCKCARRLGPRPSSVWYAMARFAGYLWWRLSCRPPLLAPAQVSFLRQEQRGKLRRAAQRYIPLLPRHPS
jgi:hypothetical protein